jgi:hypothetical protein
MFRLIVQCIGKKIKEVKNEETLNGIYAQFVGNVLLLGEIFWKPQETKNKNFLRRRLDPEYKHKDSEAAFRIGQLFLVKRVVTNIKRNRQAVLGEFCKNYDEGTMIPVIQDLIDYLHNKNHLPGLMKDAEYPKSRLRSLVDSMKSCVIVEKHYPPEVIYDKLLDLILFVLEITIVGEKTDK